MGTPKLAKGGRYNASISYKIALYRVDSRPADTSLLNNRLRALAEEKQVGDIDLLRGRKKALICALSARGQLCGYRCLPEVSIQLPN
jgi:hypothetical protein